MSSIRRDLAFRIGGATLLLLMAGGIGLYLSLWKALGTQFDRILATKAQALVTASEIDRGEFEIDLDVQAFAGFGSSSHGDFFEVYDESGASVERSPSLGIGELSKPEELFESEEGYANLLLPGGLPGRAYWTSFTPLIDLDEESGRGVESPPVMRILVASDDSGLRRTLRTVALVIALFGFGSILLSLAILHVVVKSGLKPLDRLSVDVQRIDVQHLEKRLPLEPLPEELRGVAAKLNELLERLEVSFEREKRFASDAAHELRTPLAELRAMTELGTRWPEEFTTEHGQEMLSVLDELGQLLDTLSLLARAEDGSVSDCETIDLVSSVEECVARCRPQAAGRGLTLDVRVSPDRGSPGEFRSDPILWRAIVANLVGNAVAHAPEGGVIQVEASPRHFAVENEAPDLEEADLPHLFERFWRKSASRTAKEHSGLGLSLVRAAVASLGGGCRAQLQDGRLRVEVRWTAESTESDPN